MSTTTKDVDRRGHAGAGAGERPLLDVVGADLLVPVVTGGQRRFVHLDHAASAPALRSVADAVADFLPWYASVHRGAGYTSVVSSEVLASARDQVRRFVGGRADDDVIFTRNTTDSLNLLARSLPDDTTVLTLDLEHHANLLPWRTRPVVHLATPSDLADVAGLFDSALGQVRTEHALMAVTGASNVTGEVLPIADLAFIAHRHGARIVVDAAQLAAHRSIDVRAADVDYLAFSGHKIYAPFGAGVLIGRRDWLDAAPPHLAGGGAVRAVTLDRVDWATSPARHEAGTPNVLGAVAIAEACRALDEVGFVAIEAHDAALLTRLRDGLAHVGGVRSVDAFGERSDRVGLVTFTSAVPAALLAAALSAEHGIATRDGAFCAHPLLRRLLGDDELAVPNAVPNAVRASVGVGTTVDDVDALVDAVAELSESGPRWDYRMVDGRLAPDPDVRGRPLFGTT